MTPKKDSTGWIAVCDQLPPKHEFILFGRHGNLEPIYGWYIGKATGQPRPDPHMWHDRGLPGHPIIGGIDYWMPLPNLPE